MENERSARESGTIDEHHCAESPFTRIKLWKNIRGFAHKCFFQHYRCSVKEGESRESLVSRHLKNIVASQDSARALA